MDPAQKTWNPSLRTKVLVPVTIVMVLLLTSAMLIVNLRFMQQTETNSRRELAAAMRHFQQGQARHFGSLKLRFQSLAREPHYLSAFRTADTKTIRHQLSLMVENELLANEGIVYVCYLPLVPDTDGATPPIISPSENSDDNFDVATGCHAAAQIAGQGEPATDTVRIGSNLCEVVAVPIFNETHDRVIGALVLGGKLGLGMARELGGETGGQSCTALLAGNRVIASTPPANSLPETELAAIFQRLIIRADGSKAALEQIQLAGNHYFCVGGNFPSLKGDTSLGYVLFRSYEEQLAALRETQVQLLLVSLLAILSGSLLVWWFVNRAMRPLAELRDSAEAVGRGDFSRRVKVRSRDECGQLAAAFNRMTENVRQAQTELQQTVNTLKTTQAQLVQSEKLSAVGEFVAGVAHELNNPLAAVMGFSELLKNADVDEKHRRHLDFIFKSAMRCKKIVQSLLSFARRHQPERKPVSVNKLIEEVLEIVAYQLRTSNVAVDTKFAADLPQVLADGHQIQQVVLNLVNNARQAIEAHQDSGRITITTQFAAQFIRIAVTDNGPGISPENLKRIFDPFFTTKEVGKGTGLGLSLCYGLIKEHGGNITVTSEPGHGATFTIELPASEISAPADSPAAHTDNDHSTEGAGKKILLVDDEEILLEMVRDGLKRHGYEVITANSGEAALRELPAGQFDAICSDLKMPGLNGRQVYDWIRTSQPKIARRMIFMTGDVINQSLQLFLEQEQLACLNKPFALGDLRSAIKKVIAENNGH